MKEKVKSILLLFVFTAAIFFGLNFYEVKVYAAQQDEKSQTEEKELKENSWRYSDGEKVYKNKRSIDAVPNAWDKVGDYYVNNKGDKIKGAVRKGIDVSEHNRKINWEKVKTDGIDFAIIRCGYGSDDKSQDDKYWQYNVSECERLGIPYGVYLYSYANTKEKAESEAKHVLRLLKGHSPAYPVYYDLEDDKCTLPLSSKEKAEFATIFCNTVSASGYSVGIYSNLNWWNNYLTDPAFNNASWSKWVAQYYTSCTYKGTYDIWQCTDIGNIDGITGYVDVNFVMDTVDMNQVIYQSNIEGLGWQSVVRNGAISGTEGQSRQLEEIKIHLENYGMKSSGIEYRTHIQDVGWETAWKTDGQISGKDGKRLEAIQVRLTGQYKRNYDVYYRVHVQDLGWLDWAKNGSTAGTEGYSKYVQAYQIVLVEKGESAPGSTKSPCRQPSLQYSTHVQEYGWQASRFDGEFAGTSGEAKRLEAIKIQLVNQKYSGSVQYSTHVQDYGWQNFVADGNTSGTSGESKRLEAIKIQLTGEMAKHYDIYYRVHAQTFGWLDWAKNGESAGTAGYSYRLEGIQIQLVDKGKAAPGLTSTPFCQAAVQYSTHVQDYGWQNFVADGCMAGTSGESKRLEGIRIQLSNQLYEGNIEYNTHVQDYGWLEYVRNGQVSGTSGESKRLEAIQIRLTGEMAKYYDIYYRVHAETFGWLGWAKNGEPAGSSGFSYRLEGIEIQLVEKGMSSPGSTEDSYISN